MRLPRRPVLNGVFLRTTIQVAAFVWAVLIPTAGPLGAEQNSPPRAHSIAAVVHASNDFGFRLLHQLKAGRDDNVVVSPLSLSIALAMTQNGAAGKTRTAMAQTLGLSAMSESDINAGYQAILRDLENADPKTQLEIANALWLQSAFSTMTGFTSVVRDFYEAEVANVDFANNAAAAIDKINEWAAQKTHHRINSILENGPGTQQYRLVITDAVYFKSHWVDAFDKRLTEPRDFRVLTGSQVKVPMMQREGQYDYFDDGKLQTISLPYGNDSFAMYVILPRKPHTLAELMKSLDWTRWSQLKANVDNSLQEGTVQLPRFELHWGAVLSDELKAMGMSVAFSSQADFSRAHLPPPPLSIDQVIQKTFMEVDEEGTEAAAVTAVTVAAATAAFGPRPAPFEMDVDHPFFLAIVNHSTGAILFAGAITDPAS